MYNRLIQSSAFIVIITTLAASISLSYTNAWATANNDPTQGMRITAGAAVPPTTCISNCIIVNTPVLASAPIFFSQRNELLAGAAFCKPFFNQNHYL